MTGMSIVDGADLQLGTTKWHIEVGVKLPRRELHKMYGGQQQGGICTPKGADIIFLFTGKVGRQYGYNYDGRKDDGSFHYTGEGRLGDQQFTNGNKAILDAHKKIHLFENVARSTVHYLGEYELDQQQPFYRADAKDSTGLVRSVIVFRLWPTDSGHISQVSTMTTVSTIEMEEQHTPTFPTKPSTEPSESERREAALANRYRSWLISQNHIVKRNKITLPGESRPLLTDVYDVTTGELVEAKGTASRDNVRLALGQVLDYARYVQPKTKAVLLPTRPADDLVALLASYEVQCIYEVPSYKYERA